FVSKNYTPELLKQENETEMEIAALLAHHILENADVKQIGTSLIADAGARTTKSNWVKNRSSYRD
nr:hypothetical protein [Chitinophagales bacterium]